MHGLKNKRNCEIFFSCGGPLHILSQPRLTRTRRGSAPNKCNHACSRGAHVAAHAFFLERNKGMFTLFGVPVEPVSSRICWRQMPLSFVGRYFLGRWVDWVLQCHLLLGSSIRARGEWVTPRPNSVLCGYLFFCLPALVQSVGPCERKRPSFSCEHLHNSAAGCWGYEG